jgi:hypothetical protein
MQSDPTVIRLTSSRYRVYVRGGSVTLFYDLRSGNWSEAIRDGTPDVTEAREALAAHLKRTGEGPAIIRGSGMHG